MERLRFSEMDCPIARATDVVGEGWTLLILREAFKGSSTFSELAAKLPITPTTLTRRLDALVERGLFELVAYQSTPLRHRYELTAKALDLLPILLALGEWGNRWLAPEGELITILDAESGRPVSLSIIDARTQKPLRAGKVALRAGPGASKKVRAALAQPVVLGPTRQRPKGKRPG